MLKLARGSSTQKIPKASVQEETGRPATYTFVWKSVLVDAESDKVRIEPFATLFKPPYKAL